MGLGGNNERTNPKASLDKFARFKTTPGGFEAELKTAVDKAYAAISELKELGLNLSAPIVDELAISGRMMQFNPLKFKLERVDKIVTNLKALGASREEIEKTTETIYSRVTHDHLARMAATLKAANPEKPETVFNELAMMIGTQRLLKNLLRITA